MGLLLDGGVYWDLDFDGLKILNNESKKDAKKNAR